MKAKPEKIQPASFIPKQHEQIEFWFSKRIYYTSRLSASGFGGRQKVAQMVRETYLRGPQQPFPLAANSREADIVVFWEDYQESEQTLAPKLRAEASAIGNPDKVFVVSTEDRPAGFLPGVYTGVPLMGWDQHRFRSGSYFLVMNPLIAEAASNRDRKPRLLYSFIGAATSEVRKKMFQTLRSRNDCVVQETGNLQYNIQVEDPAKRPGQHRYLEAMLDSFFVLCPRGGGHSSFRLFETMQLGRVPVILSDEWVTPQGPCWQDFSIRIAEKNVAQIEKILAQFQPRAEEMGKRARTEWESWFDPEVVPWRTLQWIYDIYLSRPHSESAYVKKWASLAWQAQWPPPLPLRIKRKLGRICSRLPSWPSGGGTAS